MDIPIAHESWTVTKPVVSGDGGMVTSQHYLASQAGAEVLRQGGNAIDAAVTAGLAISTVEPWMSGLGGCGIMMIYLAKEKTVKVVQFGVRASEALDPADYALTGEVAADLFGWPEVIEDRHTQGPYSIAVPGYVAGVSEALKQFGTLSWSDALQPAIGLAEDGMLADWYATLKIASAASQLAKYPSSRDMYLPGGQPPSGEWGRAAPRLKLGRLNETLKRLAAAGPRDFYEGEIAGKILADAKALGTKMTAADLAEYQPVITDVEPWDYHGTAVYGPPGLSAGPTMRHVHELMSERVAADGTAPTAADYLAFAEALRDAYTARLESMGDCDGGKNPSTTTHISVVDKDGNIVSLTQTLLSLFGSRVVYPATGITMNNGIMWFDPTPGRPNSIAPGKRPLSNMCPTITCSSEGTWRGLGASGGRRIMPAIFQLISFLTDSGMTLEQAFTQPRIDVSGSEGVTVDPRLPADVSDLLRGNFDVAKAQYGVFPVMYACPNVVSRTPDGRVEGASFIYSPWSKAVPT